MINLKDKTAIITGASSGIGRAAAHLFANAGASVIVGARRAEELNRLSDEISATGGQAIPVPGDITDPDYGVRLVECAMDHFGKLDIAFNNAGTLGRSAPFGETALSDWTQTIETNLTAAFLCAKPQLAVMATANRGSVIFTGSFVGHTVGFPGMAAYAASKAGLVGLTQVLAAEYGPMGVRVNALLPGGTDTPMAAENAGTPEAMDFVRGLHALKRIAEPEEVANAALFLASDAARFVTGTAFLADGGVSITRT